MRIDNAPISEETKAAITKMLNESEDKAKAIADAVEMVAAEAQKDLVDKVLAEAKRAEYDADYKKSLGLRPLSENETKF